MAAPSVWVNPMLSIILAKLYAVNHFSFIHLHFFHFLHSFHFFHFYAIMVNVQMR